jgi:hypothetical protein
VDSLPLEAETCKHSAAEPQFKIQDSKFKRMQQEQFLVEPLRAAKKFANSSIVVQATTWPDSTGLTGFFLTVNRIRLREFSFGVESDSSQLD